MIDRTVAWVVGVLLLFNVGKWMGAGLTRSGPNGILLTAGLLCVIWIGYLVWHSNQKNEQETEVHRFLVHLGSAAVISFLLAAIGLKE
jgi:hypothetical protein